MKSLPLSAFLALAIAPWSAGHAAPDPSRDAAVFGVREYIQNISLSPDGTKVAIVRPAGTRGAALEIADPSSGKAPVVILTTSGDPERLVDCGWATTTRIVCRIYMIEGTSTVPAQFTRLIAIGADGTGLTMLTERTNSRSLEMLQYGGEIIDWTGDGKGSVLMMRSYVPETTIGTNLAQTKEGNGVDLINTSSQARRTVEQPRKNAVEFISDGLGTVRIAGAISDGSGGYVGDTINYSYRKAGSREWSTLNSFKIDGRAKAGFNPVAVDPKSDVVFGFDDKDGRQALYSIALDGSMKRTLIVTRPDVDVDGLIRIGRQHRVVGASWANERRETAYFDPEL